MNPCSVCGRPNRKQIDAEIASGKSLRQIAAHHGLSKSALARHKQAHLKAEEQPGQTVDVAVKQRESIAVIYKPSAREQLLRRLVLEAEEQDDAGGRYKYDLPFPSLL